MITYVNLLLESDEHTCLASISVIPLQMSTRNLFKILGDNTCLETCLSSSFLYFHNCSARLPCDIYSITKHDVSITNKTHWIYYFVDIIKACISMREYEYRNRLSIELQYM